MDDILDLDWVLSHETKIEAEEATLFQKCVSMELLLIGTAMLHENNIPFQVKLPKSDESNQFGSIQEIHINEKDFSYANKLLDQLLNGYKSYPKRLSSYYSDAELKNMMESNSNPYKEILLKMELEERGIQPVKIKREEITGVSSLLIVIIFIVIFGLIILAKN